MNQTTYRAIAVLAGLAYVGTLIGLLLKGSN